jgi:sugar/nucleoside kinase (ribokinase family)
VLSIGRIYCDLIFTGLNAMPVLGREIFADDMAIMAGGGAFIVAAYSANTGRPTALLSRLGTDSLSAGLLPQLGEGGVDLQFLEHAADAGPQLTVAIIKDQERAFLSRRAGSARPATLEAALAWDQACHLHIAEYATLIEIPGLVTQAKAHGLTVSLDPSWDESLIYDPAFLNNCKGVDLFLPNEEEANAITGHADPEQSLRRLADIFPVVAVKAGARGAYLTMSSQFYFRAAPNVAVVDTTGAGDAFDAGLINAWLDRSDAEACLEAGIGLGSLAVQAAGGAAALKRAQSAG